ncbi:MAG: hypothetical protein QOK37_1762 [Thermoanaerobaculia bacterium]|jgi:hypothetical protein|nr:hypothetical protein [Thermoanaerobaculia bacterium]
MVALAERCNVDVFCVHDTVTDWGPFPAVGDTVSQDPFPEADQLPPWHPLGDPVSATLTEPACAVGFADVELVAKLLQVGGVVPDWFAVKVLLAIAALPLRDVVEVFCDHDTVTDWGPFPLPGETVSQEPFPDVLQLPPWHPLGDPMSETLTEPACDAGFADDGLIVKPLHVGGVDPAWLAVNVLFAIVALPRRDVVEVF